MTAPTPPIVQVLVSAQLALLGDADLILLFADTKEENHPLRPFRKMIGTELFRRLHRANPKLFTETIRDKAIAKLEAESE